MKSITSPQGAPHAHPVDPLPDLWGLVQALAVMPEDVVLAVDDQGQLLAAAQGGDTNAWVQSWVGQSWPDTADPLSRPKATALLESLAQDGRTGRRELNHVGPDGATHLVAWAGTRLGPDGQRLLMGRDLAALQAQQQRLVAAQQDMESCYWEAAPVHSRVRPR